MKLCALAGAAALAIVASGHADAAVIGFDDITGGGPNSSYWESNFYFAPAGSTGDIKCYDTKCLKEVNQTVGTTMIYDTDGPDGDGVPDGTHDLNFFYFVAIGVTTTGNDSFSLYGYDDTYDADDDTTWAGALLYSVDFVVGDSLGSVSVTDYTGGSATASIAFAKDIGSPPSDSSVINYNVGYWVDLTGWEDITYSKWFINTAEGPTDGQWRLDCVGANEPQGATGARSGCQPAVIPVPPTLPLMASALGLVGILTRRTWKKAA